ncbi:MAG: TlpA disulfide reductase family protein [Prolixibacteraceae bacterium]|nr:TlpA disulfide reductase family protein [Prolixibacteraceae bacterium]
MNRGLLFILVLAVFACNRKPAGYELVVKLDGAEGNILLEKRGVSSWIPVDTAQIVDGVAVLKGKVDIPEDYYLSVSGQPPKTIIFIENSKMEVRGDAKDFENIEVTGSVTHDQYRGINEELRQIGEQYMSLYQLAREADTAGDTLKALQLIEQVKVLYDSTNEVQVSFIRNNPSSFINPYLLSRVQYYLGTAELGNLVSSLDPKMEQLPSIIALKERLEKLESVEIGKIAPDFTMNDPEGKPVIFSDVYSQNELTLLDFWAAWCGPCRAENPNVVAVFNEFKDQGFGVFGVSLDRDKQSWLKAIEDDRLSWIHVSDLAYWSNSAAKLYAVNSIPASLIVDRNGVIKAKDRRGEDLRKTVDELLK